MTYEVQTKLRPAHLAGISEEQIDQHWKLYEGYVSNVNSLRAELAALRKEGEGNTPIYADRRRRFGFEYNGMVLHEYYFGNLHSGVSEPPETSGLRQVLAEQFGSFDGFKEDFAAAGMSRSIGWAILYYDPASGALDNDFVQLHEEGNVAGFAPLLVMDAWEHAYMVDYGALGRGDYIDAFLRNIDWRVVEDRYVMARMRATRF